MSNEKLRILMNNNILRYTGSVNGVIERTPVNLRMYRDTVYECFFLALIPSANLLNGFQNQ